MKWIVKAITQKILSNLPNPEYFNYLAQKYIMKRFPMPDYRYIGQINYVLRYLQIFRNYSDNIDLSNASFYEFGGGWHLAIPLTFAGVGVGSQTVIDIRKNIRVEFIRRSIEKIIEFKSLILDEGYFLRLEVFERHLNFNNESELEDFGIYYISPVDARKTGFQSNRFDFISSTASLEHIPALDIVPVLKECCRILRPGGIMACVVECEDHYSWFDKSINRYNFLKYPEWLWNMFFNSSLHCQNRLRANDYLDLFKQSNFKILEFIRDEPTEEDISLLKEININKQFINSGSLKDIGVKNLFVVLKKL